LTHTEQSEGNQRKIIDEPSQMIMLEMVLSQIRSLPLLTATIVASMAVSAAASVWKWTMNGDVQSENKQKVLKGDVFSEEASLKCLLEWLFEHIWSQPGG
jgi:hypothetical protein